jgi:phenylpropionate dioxygenase-like ring-hydroxylating dioxygenase large terminal subunit
MIGTEVNMNARRVPVPASKIPDDVDPATSYIQSWYARDVAMSWEVLMENITDPSHLPFSHHHVVPSVILFSPPVLGSY